MLIRRLKDMYSAIQSGHIFDDMTREESDNRIATLEEAIKTVDPDEERAAIWDMCNEKEYQG